MSADIRADSTLNMGPTTKRMKRCIAQNETKLPPKVIEHRLALGTAQNVRGKSHSGLVVIARPQRTGAERGHRCTRVRAVLSPRPTSARCSPAIKPTMRTKSRVRRAPTARVHPSRCAQQCEGGVPTRVLCVRV